jgi:DNA-directed RNA polymerase subunit RPC12/RpoP
MHKVDLDDVMSAIENEEYMGFCVDCGAEAYNVEPDAREYECEECGAQAVYGAEELLIMLA